MAEGSQSTTAGETRIRKMSVDGDSGRDGAKSTPGSAGRRVANPGVRAKSDEGTKFTPSHESPTSMRDRGE
jgi:hypothetical protein